MHEGSLTQDLFDHVLTHAREAGARRVTRVRVTIGALSDATPDSIQFYWDTMAPGTIAEGALLEFDTAPARGRCPACNAEFEVGDRYAACPQCGAFPVTITSGDGVYLTGLEVETEGEQHTHIHE